MFNEINTNSGLVHYGFPSIALLPTLIYSVNRYATYTGDDSTGEPTYDENLPKPVLRFLGTTKLHGTNTGLVIDFHNETIYFESKDVIIYPSVNNKPAEDPFGFAAYMSSIQEDIVNMVKANIDAESIDWSDKVFVLYGEWCGGSIQGGVALKQLEKMFVALKGAIRTRDKVESRNINWIPKEQFINYKIPSKKFLNIYDFKTWEIEIDFNAHENMVPYINEITKEVEDECPFSKQLGISGTGEGIVWEAISGDDFYKTCDFWFKSKGSKHSKHKVKIDRPVDNEKVARMMDIADSVTPSWRLEQMFNETFTDGTLDRKKLTNYIKSVFTDIEKEEGATLKNEGVVLKDIAFYVGNITRDYFFALEKDFLANVK